MTEYVFKLPDLGEGTVEAEIVEWYVSIGDEVTENQTVLDVMTDKATVEVPSPVSGRILRLAGGPGDVVAVGSELFAIEVAGASRGSAKPDSARATVAPVAPPPPVTPLEPLPATNTNTNTSTSTVDENSTAPAPAMKAEKTKKILTSPAVRRHATEAGVNLQEVDGTGPNGRIVMEDLTNHIQRMQNTDAAAGTGTDVGYVDTKVIGIRRLIAQRLSQSKREIPHFSYVEEVDVTELESLREHLNKRYDKRLSILPFISLALLKSLPEHAQCNAHFDAENGMLRQFNGVHLGIAARTAEGLKVPVVHDAHLLDIWQLNQKISELAEKARSGTASPSELTGSTITITSLGKLGGLVSTPIINHPEVAIVGVNKLTEKVVLVEGSPTARTVLNLSSSFDHRFVDGYDAAAFIQAIKEKLEQPAALFIPAPE